MQASVQTNLQTTLQLSVNGIPCEAKPNESLLQVLRRQGIEIPTLCHIKDLLPTGACRLCVVEVEGHGPLLPSCSATVWEGMKVRTHSVRVLQARKKIVELLLANHPDDCLYCAKSNNCELQDLSKMFNIQQRLYTNTYNPAPVDLSSPSIEHDASKCILCGRCVRVCEEVQNVGCLDFIGRGSQTTVGPAFGQGLNISNCINCGQCVLHCPTGALVEKSNVSQFIEALSNPDNYIVAQHAPSVSVTLGEFYGFPMGTDVIGLLVAGLKKLGVRKVFDTSFSADLTIMEEASELVHRIQNGGVLPMMTSCSPGWVKYMEQQFSDLLPHLSTCKSPQQMLGALIKTYFAEKENLDPKKIVSLSLMPCTAKKFEAQRPEMGRKGTADVDLVLTTREVAEIFRIFNIDPSQLEPEAGDNPFDSRSSAGKIFGTSGGVMEAALRTAYYMIRGQDAPDLNFHPLRGLGHLKEAKVQIGALEVRTAVVNGVGNAKKLLEEIRQGSSKYHFIEVMTCPGGCISGGGQPYRLDKTKVMERMKSLYSIDASASVRCSHHNPMIKKVYKEYFDKPLSHKSHELLHTHYMNRSQR